MRPQVRRCGHPLLEEICIGRAGAGSKYLELRADAFSAFNHVNATNFVGVHTSPSLGHANSAFPARQIQLSVKFSF
jgi:hypothetical protein